MKDGLSVILKKYGKDKSQLVSILQDIQAEYNYLPREALEKLSKKMDIPQSHVYSMATFFRAFSLNKRGKHIVNVCLGTACHVRGGELILESLERQLGVGRGQTTPDLKFTLESVNCMGCCATGPVVKIGEEYFGHMTNDKVEPMLKKYRE
ncbi:MAG: NAD(P)H-dependent oxidoreductase subunit E [Chloroflexi bacterium]|nr:NAD(P)H-dependent oxidoreductase subunit E [Chloroflexota bacterium]